MRVAALVAALVTATVAGPALAQAEQRGTGYVANLSGPLFAVKADGSRRVLAIQSTIDAGDTLVTEDKTYARVRFTDQSEVTLRPGTQFQIENYSFDRQAPDRDNSAFRLLKGAFRTVTGLIGKRGNRDAYKLSTATATIGIRGTVFGVTVCQAAEAAAKEAKTPEEAEAAARKAKEACGGLEAGTYVNVIDGQVAVDPLSAAPLVLSAGQFGYAPVVGPAVQLPADPGVGRMFSPPASFILRDDAPPPGALGALGSASARPSGGGACDVR